MNPNTEYEKFTQEIYQKLVNADVLKTTKVQHNVKLKGRSGQEHQIDVYWEYEIAGTKHKVAIECKNYNQAVPIGRVRDFFGALYDLVDVKGIMVTKVGYQKGAKEYASYYGIDLKELRNPNPGETIIGEIEHHFNIAIRHRLFLVDENYAETKGFNVSRYKQRIDSIGISNTPKWINSTHIPLQLIDNNIIDSNGENIASLDEIEKTLPEKSDSDIIFKYKDAYVNTIWGKIKINEIKYEYKYKNEKKIIAIDAQDFVKAILKDALNGEIRLIADNMSSIDFSSNK
mgnify:CR=1 FL=1